MWYARYDTNTGEIVGFRFSEIYSKDQLEISEDCPLVVLGGEEKPDKKLFYIQDGNVVARPACPVTIDKTTILANGVDEVKVSNIPNNSVVIVDGVLVDLGSDTTIELSSDEPGNIYVRIDPPFPIQEFSATIVCAEEV